MLLTFTKPEVIFLDSVRATGTGESAQSDSTLPV